MRTVRLPLALALALALVLGVAMPARAADGITPGALYQAGPDGRALLGGEWLFRFDGGQGAKQGFERQTSRTGWSAVTVPNAWNAGDESDASMLGTVAWYRKDFDLPSRRRELRWVVRFESVNYRTRVWLNGRQIGANTGAYLPFEVRLPDRLLNRSGRNRLVVRVDNRRRPTDFPPSGLQAGTERPTGGWWNYGGIVREVYLRRVEGVDVNTVQVLPELPCATCAATVTVRATARNLGDREQAVDVVARFGTQRVRLGRARLSPLEEETFTGRIRVARPRVWSPERPSLYRVRVGVSVEGREVAGWSGRSGIRSVRVVNGVLQLNGRPINVRGVGLHEDDRQRGFAIDNARRAQIVASARELGADMLRAHYPLHPQLYELADEQGLLVWSEIPVFAVKTQYLKSLAVRQAAADELSDNVLSNANHPSIITWSIGNELSSRPGPVQGDYIRRAARQAKGLDPTRPVAYAFAGYPSSGCQPEYAPLDILGANEYFGWYPGPSGQLADRDLLSEYLDALRACYPDKALMITEFGAEANRPGPVEEKGTFEFQQDFVNFHLGTYAQKPWLSGASYWTLQEFRVRPGWEGGNPRPRPPIHEKGLLTFDGAKKPAWADVQRSYQATPLYK
ncbi:MAG: beta galactosidase jelly roll domain-containing protein [Solirubrobacterales bacterium]|nr:beta galactosidase jelly roll domain-containing protein [Solirubrobacterales bacterium]